MKYKIINSYKFVQIESPDYVRDTLRQLCGKYPLKGTILISTEGYNIAITGEKSAVDAFEDDISQLSLFSDITFLYSYADTLAFDKLCIKVKPEIITIKDETIKPLESPVDYVEPTEFRDWLNNNEDVVVLDTRNDYEVEYGTFENAVQLNIEHFSDFEDALSQLPEDLKDKKVVSFCTGGVRCEKAGIVLKNAGFDKVYQLKGGILNYFNECGGDHYRGDCFVFDNRIALTPELTPKSASNNY